MWLPYIIFREAYLQAIRESVSARSVTRNWTAGHVAGGVIPLIPGC